MDFQVHDSSGIGRSFTGSAPYQNINSDMESQIHILEQEAYGAVLRAFKAQSDALTWEKEGLITELRRELRVSDDEHRELLTQVNADGLIHKIREWRKAGGRLSTTQIMPQPVHDQLQSPTISASRKKQKTSQSVPFGTQSQTLHPQSIAATPQPSLVSKWGPTSGTVGRRPQHGQPVLSSPPAIQYQQSNQGPGGRFTNELAVRTSDPLIGRKVMTRWPEDSNFYEAVITDYNPIEGRHALVYDIGTPNESLEWVDFKEISPEDIRWIGDDPGISQLNVGSGQGFGGNTPNAGQGRGLLRDQLESDHRPSQNGVVKKIADDIEILHTDTLIQKVEKVVAASHPDLLELEKAKKMLKEHEQALLDVIAKLADACDDASDGEHHGLSVGMERGQGHLHGRNNSGPNMASEMRSRSSSSYDITRGQMPFDHQQDDDVVVI
ncbi:unnamed protein product [Coffea canephora]|uniref:ENT domain-containing protein n=1 Tax=Coffea canephora TaxID=49390 RepID=A0A068UNW7_COFCA|nr:unnamed protein product [Coffea canephora]